MCVDVRWPPAAPARINAPTSRESSAPRTRIAGSTLVGSAMSVNGRLRNLPGAAYPAITNRLRLSTWRMLTGTFVRYPVFGSIVIVPVAPR